MTHAYRLAKSVNMLLLICMAFCLNGYAQSQNIKAHEPANLSKQKTLVFGVVPQQSAKRLAATWGPIVQELSEKTGFDIRFATAPSIPEFEKRLLAKAYDIAYMNPYHYAVFSEKAGYEVIVKQKDKALKGIVVVRKDATFRSLADLNEQTLAFPAPLAFAATLIPTANLKSQGIAITQRFVKSHDSVYMGVAKGFFPAGGGVMRTLNAAPPEIREQLRILWTSKAYTPHAIAVSPYVDEATKTILVRSFISINDETKLRNINFNGFEQGLDEQWDTIRELEIDAFTQPSQ